MAKFISHGKTALHGLPNSDVALGIIKAAQGFAPVQQPVATQTPVIVPPTPPVMAPVVFSPPPMVESAPVATELPVVESVAEKLPEIVVEVPEMAAPKVEFRKRKNKQ